jgi:hypothetical protein
VFTVVCRLEKLVEGTEKSVRCATTTVLATLLQLFENTNATLECQLNRGATLRNVSLWWSLDDARWSSTASPATFEITTPYILVRDGTWIAITSHLMTQSP